MVGANFYAFCNYDVALPCTGAIDSKQPRLRSKIAKELKMILKKSIQKPFTEKLYLSFIALFKDASQRIVTDNVIL